MSVRIGNAVCNSKGKATGDALGNQNGKELRIQDYYNNAQKPWTHVIRAKDAKVREQLAKSMEDACNNMHIGYSQQINERVSLYFLAEKKKWKISKVKTDCACDCSSLVSVCVNSAGISVPRNMSTYDELGLLRLTGDFDILEDKKYITNSRYLMRGDILFKIGHTAIVLDDGVDTIADRYKVKYFPTYDGKSNSIVDALIALNEDYSFAYRKNIAKANGISLYIGTGAQNTVMLNLLKEGNLIKP